MEQLNRQTETRQSESGSQTARRIIGVIFSLFEIVLAFRLIFKLLGANPQNSFVNGIYAVTQFFVGIFAGIFSKVTATGAVTQAVFEPATLIAMIVLALIAAGIMKLMAPQNGNRVEKTVLSQTDGPSK